MPPLPYIENEKMTKCNSAPTDIFITISNYYIFIRRSATNITQESNILAGAEANIYNIELYISGYKVTSGAISTIKISFLYLVSHSQ